MRIYETNAKSLLRKYKQIDPWFLSRYGMNLYRGCAHDCCYCDGRAEKYRVDGSFGQDISVKINAPELLQKELDPSRKRKPMRRSYLMLGGGVGDSYQPIEQRLEITRRVLHVVEESGWPVHVLTRSTLVERDVDVIRRIHEKSGAIVSMSLSTVDDGLARKLEPGASLPSARLAALSRIRRAGIPTGVFLLPVVPFITDSPEQIFESVRAIREHHVEFALFGGMTLKEGRQKEHFMSVIEELRPDLEAHYHALYRPNMWGNADAEYYDSITKAFNAAADRLGVRKRIPLHLYSSILDENDRVAVALQNLHYYCQSRDRGSSYRQAAQSVAALEIPLSEMRTVLRSLPGVGPFTEGIIREILDTGRSSYLESFENRFPKRKYES